MNGSRGSWISVVSAAIAILSLTTGQGCPGRPASNPSAEQPAQYKAVTAAEAQKLIQDHQDDADFIILDVRTPQEFATGHITNAVNISVTGTSPSFSDAISGLDKARTYLVCCSSGHRSPTAIEIMKQQGFKNLYELIGGLAAWQAAGLPVVQ